MARDLSETRKSLAQLSLMNARLNGLVVEADKRNRELTLINSMAEKLQSCLFLDEASQEIVYQRAEEIRREFPKVSVVHRGQVLQSVTVSVGVAMFPEHGSTGRDVLRAADNAMYRAKAQGRNRVVVAEGRVAPPR